MNSVHEYRPRVRRSVAQIVLAVIFGPIMLGGALLLGTIALGSSQVTYTIHGGTLEASSGSYLDGSRSFALASMIDARVVDLHGGRRTRGTAAPGICTGQWWYPEIGPVWQATNCSSRAVVLRVAGEERAIVLSPPDPDAFLARLSNGADAVVTLPPGDGVLLHAIPGAASAVMLVTSLMMLGVFLRGPQRMRYLVGDGRLEIQTIFMRKSWPASSLRARAHTPRVSLRLAGTAFPGYYTGLFRADGKNTRFYATGLQSGILIEGPARVFVTPEEPAAFLAALRDAGCAVDAA